MQISENNRFHINRYDINDLAMEYAPITFGDAAELWAEKTEQEDYDSELVEFKEYIIYLISTIPDHEDYNPVFEYMNRPEEPGPDELEEITSEEVGEEDEENG